MSTFSSSEAKIEIRKRFDRLTPQTPRLWGRMSPQQMLCHLTDGYRVSSGDIRPKPADNFFTRSVLRLFALHTSMAWPKGVKTMPEVDQEQGGTKPESWDRDLTELLRRIDEFKARNGQPHPIFGPLTENEWNVWAYRHADHHLRQFGL